MDTLLIGKILKYVGLRRKLPEKSLAMIILMTSLSNSSKSHF